MYNIYYLTKEPANDGPNQTWLDMYPDLASASIAPPELLICEEDAPGRVEHWFDGNEWHHYGCYHAMTLSIDPDQAVSLDTYHDGIGRYAGTPGHHLSVLHMRGANRLLLIETSDYIHIHTKARFISRQELRNYCSKYAIDYSYIEHELKTRRCY